MKHKKEYLQDTDQIEKRTSQFSSTTCIDSFTCQKYKLVLWLLPPPLLPFDSIKQTGPPVFQLLSSCAVLSVSFPPSSRPLNICLFFMLLSSAPFHFLFIVGWGGEQNLKGYEMGKRHGISKSFLE